VLRQLRLTHEEASGVPELWCGDVAVAGGGSAGSAAALAAAREGASVLLIEGGGFFGNLVGCAAAARARNQSREAVPRGRGGRHRTAPRAARALSPCPVLPDRRNHPGDGGRVPGSAERRLHRRIMAGTADHHRGSGLGRDRAACRAIPAAAPSRSARTERIIYRERAEAAAVLESLRYQAFRADLDGCLHDERVPEGEGVLFFEPARRDY
jgi:glycine/D-amino acid oxidase-like deaminating enzyme